MANLEPTRFNDIVISENRWRSVEGPRHPILVSKGSTSDSRTPNGERSSKRCSVTIWSRAADLRFPSGSETLSLPMRARSLRSRSHARLYVPSAEAPRTGNGGDWQRPYAGQLRGDANEPKTRNRAGVNPNQFTVHGSGATSLAAARPVGQAWLCIACPSMRPPAELTAHGASAVWHWCKPALWLLPVSSRPGI